MQTTTVQGSGKCPKLPWMIDFHSTADGKILNQQLKAAFAENHLEHLCSLNEKSKTRRKRLTQFSIIIPPSLPTERIEEYLKAGMTVALLRLDYFTVAEIQETIKQILEANEHFGKKIGRVYPLGIALEISEPEMVTGKLLKPLTEIKLEKGDKTKLTANPRFAQRVSKEYVYVNYDEISDVVKPGDTILLGDDNIRLSAYDTVRDVINCVIDRAGLLLDNLSVKLPNALLPKSEEKIKATLEEVHEKCQIDMIFVGPAKIDMAKDIFGPTVLVFAKMEYSSSLEVFDEVVAKADGVLLNGEKLLATSRETVFLLQKSIIARSNKLGKPVVATIDCHSLTKAQINDIANTVIDGVDGLLLPPDLDLVESISLVCKAAESAIYERQLFEDLAKLRKPPFEPIISVAMAAVQASFNSNAAAIILLTTTGRSAKLISTFRPRCPIIALTRFGRIAKQLMIYKGVIPIFYVKSGDPFQEDLEKKMQLGMTFGKRNGYIRMGDAVVIVFGTRNNVGFKNCLEVVFASEYDTITGGEDADL